ncbi:MAG TPA: hypothetical protein VL970_10910, partial [Candidatus Acidoferrales bacterium]|nr:hypothetical protein [Candidatus Acidoferrales bacterium]
ADFTLFRVLGLIVWSAETGLFFHPTPAIAAKNSKNPPPSHQKMEPLQLEPREIPRDSLSHEN